MENKVELKMVATSDKRKIKYWDNAMKEINDIMAKDESEGKKDMGYAKALMIAMSFFEGVFTQCVVPNPLEIEVPKGLFRLTAMEKDGKLMWLIRNDTTCSISTVDPQSIGNWAVEKYPQGIGEEGYEFLAIDLLSAGGDDSLKEEIYKNSFVE